MEKISSAFDYMQKAFLDNVNLLLDDKIMFESIKTAFLTSSKNEVTREELFNAINNASVGLFESIRLILPAVVTIGAILFSFIAIYVFSATLKTSGIKIYKGARWLFTISGFGARLYNILFFITLLGSFFGIAQLLMVTFLNVVIIMTLPLSYVGLKSIYAFLRSKGLSCVPCIIIMVTVFLLAFTFLSYNAFVLIAFIGVYAITITEHIYIIQNPRR